MLDRVTNDQDVVIVHRRNAPDVAILPASELSSLMETAHLFRSPENAKRLLAAYNRSLKGEGTEITIEELKKAVGL